MQAHAKLTVDDCVERIMINGAEISLASIPQAQRCDTVRGFVFDFTPHLREGINTITFHLQDHGGGYKVFYFPTLWGGLQLDPAMLLLLVIPLLVAWQTYFAQPVLRTTGWAAIPGAVVLYAGFALYALRFLSVDVTANTHDFHGHSAYIQAIFRLWWLPSPYSCIECYQPPLYHIVAAVLYGLGETLGMANPFFAAKALSLCIYMGLIGAHLRLMQQLRLRPAFFLLGLALFVFWPIGVVKATDINNDMLVMACILWSFCHTVEWYQKPEWKYARNALLLGTLGMCVKSSAMVAFAMFAIATVLLLYERRLLLKTVSTRRYVLLALLCIILSVANTARLYASKEKHDENRSLLVFHDMSGHPGLWYSDDRPAHYLVFQYETFLTEPFYNSFEDKSGRKYFWNALLKTSLFGEWVWKKPLVAIWLSILFLAMLLVVCFTAFRKKKEGVQERRARMLAGVMMGLLVAMLMAFRAQFPAGCSQDVRYIYAVIPLFAALYASTAQQFYQQKKQVLSSATTLLGAIFIGLSVYFIAVQ